MYYIDDYSGFSAPSGTSVLRVSVLGILLFIALAIYLVFYIFESIGLYTMAKRRGIKYPGLAWVPIGNAWIIGSLADHYMNITELKNTKSRYILLWLDVIIGVLGIIVSIVLLGFGMHTIIEAFNSRYYGANSYILSMLGMLGLTGIIWLLAVTQQVFVYIAFYRIFKSCQPSNAVLYLILSIFVNVSLPFILFAIRNKDEGMIPAYINRPYGEENR